MYREIIEDLKPYKPGKNIEDIKKEYGLDNVIKLASNENPYGCSEKVSQTLRDFKGIEIYPDNNCTKLREKLSKKLGVDKEQLIFGNGSTEIISFLSRAILEEDSEIIACTPTFPIYKSEGIIGNSKVVEIPLKNYRFDLDGILEKINDKTKIIYIANPNNPTGTIITKDEQLGFLSKVPKNIFVVLDEAYYEFVVNEEYPDSISLLKEFSNIVIMRTFSKIYGLAGLRVGYGIANKEVISNLEKVRNPFNITSVSIETATIALEDEPFVKDTIQKNKEALEYMYVELDKLNIQHIKSYANFIMINVKENGEEVFKKLLSKGFIVRPGFPGMGSYIRVSIGTMEQMKEFVLGLKEMII